MTLNLVESVFVSQSPDGIVCVHIHTRERWLAYSRISVTEYEIRSDGLIERVEIDTEFLNPQVYYSISTSQEKDRIVFQYTPKHLINPRIISRVKFKVSILHEKHG